MASVKTVWGIDIGKCALKALKLQSSDGELRVEAFDVIEHPKILSQPDADRDQLIRNALDQFIARNNVSDAGIVIAAPGQSGFTRFVKLPPVEAKQVPEIVRFEAEQQIPFDINEVEWRWQAFLDPDSPDIEVGIFAMKRTDVASILDRFGEVGLPVEAVQMAPLALYNFMDADAQAVEDGATLLVDIGADKTDLVVSDGPRIWTRTLQLGGNNFTEALVKAFKLSFAKAEKLKRTAATSKYARQIFQSMRPVFAELVQDIQRSIGFYTSLHRESRFKKVVGLGNGFRLPGLQKFLEQNLGIAVVRVDSFNKISASTTVNAPAFTENVPSFAVAYGLALQGLGLAKINVNLLPGEIGRKRLWSRKRWWFVGAAAALLGAMGGWVGASYSKVASAGYGAEIREVRDVLAKGAELKNQLQQVAGQDKSELDRVAKYGDMLRWRDCWPTLTFVVGQTINSVATDQSLCDLQNLDKLMKIDRSRRKIINVENLCTAFRPEVVISRTPTADEMRKLDQDLANMFNQAAAGSGGAAVPADPGMGGMGGPMGGEGGPMGGPMGGPPAAAPAVGTPVAPANVGKGRCYYLFLRGTTPRSEQAVTFLSDLKNQMLTVANARNGDMPVYPQFEVVYGALLRHEPVVPAAAAGAPMAGLAGGTPERIVPDPLTGENMSKDTRFVVGWIVMVKDPQPASPAAK